MRAAKADSDSVALVQSALGEQANEMQIANQERLSAQRDVHIQIICAGFVWNLLRVTLTAGRSVHLTHEVAPAVDTIRLVCHTPLSFMLSPVLYRMKSFFDGAVVMIRPVLVSFE